MSTEQNQTVASTETDAGEGRATTEVETIAISKKDYEALNQTVGSLKRELKDLKKSEKPIETQQTKADDSALLQKLERISFRQAGLTHQDDIELARATAKKWQVDIDEVLMDDDFKVKLERQQTTRSNIESTTGLKGSSGSAEGKNSPAYWKAKGQPPTPDQVPDKQIRRKIIRDMMKQSDEGKGGFYNE